MSMEIIRFIDANMRALSNGHRSLFGALRSMRRRGRALPDRRSAQPTSNRQARLPGCAVISGQGWSSLMKASQPLIARALVTGARTTGEKSAVPSAWLRTRNRRSLVGCPAVT